MDVCRGRTNEKNYSAHPMLQSARVVTITGSLRLSTETGWIFPIKLYDKFSISVPSKVLQQSVSINFIRTCLKSNWMETLSLSLVGGILVCQIADLKVWTLCHFRLCESHHEHCPKSFILKPASPIWPTCCEMFPCLLKTYAFHSFLTGH